MDTAIATVGHPFYSARGTWVPARSLRPGDRVRSMSGELTVATLRTGEERVTVYNLEVEVAHTYFVGTQAAWVHNTCQAPKASGAGGMAGRRLGHTFSKHGAENTAQLLKEAAGSGKPVGQWMDNAAAERFIAEHVGQLQNGARTFDLPPGLGRVVNPDGTFSAATKARLVPSGTGVKTAYPFIE